MGFGVFGFGSRSRFWGVRSLVPSRPRRVKAAVRGLKILNLQLSNFKQVARHYGLDVAPQSVLEHCICLPLG